MNGFSLEKLARWQIVVLRGGLTHFASNSRSFLSSAKPLPGKSLQHFRVGPSPKICTHALLKEAEKAASGAAKYELARNIE